jgi:transposase
MTGSIPAPVRIAQAHTRRFRNVYLDLRRVPPHRDRLKPPESVSAQSGVSVTRSDLLTIQVARDFDLTETAVRKWVKQAERDAGTRVDGALTSAEREELVRLRRECRRLREDVEILKRATAFFVTETR